MTPRSALSDNSTRTIQEDIASAVKSVDNAIRAYSQRETLRSLSNETRSSIGFG